MALHPALHPGRACCFLFLLCFQFLLVGDGQAVFPGLPLHIEVYVPVLKIVTIVTDRLATHVKYF